MDKWLGRQNAGNHCCRIEYRKKNEKKWRQNKRHLGHWAHQHWHPSWCRTPEGEETEKGPEKIFKEIIAENFLNMGKEIVNQVQEAQGAPGRINPGRNTLKHTVTKLTKIKEGDKILKATREKWQHAR